VRFLTPKPDHDLTYDDVFMAPRRSSVTSRLDVDLTSTDALALPLPLVVANMTAISGRRMAETIARRGGIAIIPQDLPTQIVANTIAKVKAAHTVFDTPVTVSPNATVGDALALVPKRAHGLVVAVQDGRPVGTMTASAAEGLDRFAQVHEAMSTDLTLVSPTASPTEVFDELTARRHRAGGGRRRPAGRPDDDQGGAAGRAVHAGHRRAGPTADRRGRRHLR
jgi:IMP dehydrogenase